MSSPEIMVLVIASCLLGMLIGKTYFTRPVSLKAPSPRRGSLSSHDEGIEKLYQNMEDLRVSRHIHNEAFRLYQEFVDSPILDMGEKKFKGGIIITNPCGMIYSVHHESSAKYLNADIYSLIMQEYDAFRDRYEDEMGEFVTWERRNKNGTKGN